MEEFNNEQLAFDFEVVESETAEDTVLDQGEMEPISSSFDIRQYFSTEEFGINSLELGEFGSTHQLYDRVISTPSEKCIEVEIIVKNKGKDQIIEELISILNNALQINWVRPVLQKDVQNLGEKGIREFLLTQYLSRINSRVLRDFLKKKRNIDPYSLYKLINRIKDHENNVSKKLNKSPEKLTNADLADIDSMKSLVTTEYYLRSFTQLFRTLDPDSNASIKHIPTQYEDLNHSIFKLYERDLRSRNRSKDRVDKMKRSIKRFFKWLMVFKEFQPYTIHTIPVWRITRKHLYEYKNYLIRLGKNGTYTMYGNKQHFKDVKTFIKRLYELNILKEDVGRNLPNIKASEYFYRDLPAPEDLEALFKSIKIYSPNPNSDLLAFCFIAYLGIRVCELYKLRWEDINLGHKTVVIHSKGKKKHMLPIPEVICDLLNIHINDENGYIFRQKGDSDVRFRKRYVEKFILYRTVSNWNIDGGPHLLRHWYITSLAKQEMDLEVIKTLARHDDIKTTSKYIHYYSNELQEAVNQINYGGIKNGG